MSSRKFVKSCLGYVRCDGMGYRVHTLAPKPYQAEARSGLSSVKLKHEGNVRNIKRLKNKCMFILPTCGLIFTCRGDKYIQYHTIYAARNSNNGWTFNKILTQGCGPLCAVANFSPFQSHLPFYCLILPLSQ
jgi:hypothetical protein